MVKRLTRDLVGKGYHVFMDSFLVLIYIKNYLYIIYMLLVHLYIVDVTSLLTLCWLQGGVWGNVCNTVRQDTQAVIFMSTGHNPAHTTVYSN